MASAARIAAHLKKYLIAYVILAILIALPIGYYNAGFFKAHKEIVKNAILVLAIGTLLPSMIQLRSEKMGGELRSKLKEAAVAITIIFVVTPLIAMVFAAHIGDKVIGIGYIAANSVPASSASVAYVMLAEGNIELATALVILSILIALFAAPAYIALYAQSVHVALPITALVKSVVIALLLPLVLGQAIRYCFIKRRAGEQARASESSGGSVPSAEDRIMRRIKPYLSIWTVTFMLALIGVLIANKARLLISNPGLALYIISAQLVIYATVILSLIAASRALGIGYREHMAMTFISLTKNESVAATMAVLAIGPTAALPAALIPAIQPLVATLYISIAHTVRRVLGGRGKEQ